MTIFKDPNALAAPRAKGTTTALAQSMVQSNSIRRIATNTNGTFKRIVGGEQIGNAIRGEFNCIIVDALPKVSRTYYAGKYDPNAKATLPDCWSNLGEKPEAAAKAPQASACISCPQNVKGSGENGGRACRYQRRIAILVMGDPTGDVYQFNVPAKSLFGKGVGNVHPFESYVKYLVANGESPDTVVTNISYDLNADSMELQFTPLRGITNEEFALVTAAQADPETKNYIQLTVSPVAAAPKKAAPAAVVEEEEEEAPAPAALQRSDEPDDEEPVVEQPKRSAKPAASAPAAGQSDLSSIIDAWGADEE